MKSLVVYSSTTGNTRKLAEIVCQELPVGTMLITVEEAPDPAGYDFLALGFWLQGGKPDPKSQSYLQRLQEHQRVFLFATHGARPDSEHSRNGMNQALSMVQNSKVVGTFCCHGEVNPKVLEMAKAKPAPPPWLADADDAVGHPNATDLANLRLALNSALKKIDRR